MISATGISSTLLLALGCIAGGVIITGGIILIRYLQDKRYREANNMEFQDKKEKVKK